MALLGRMVSSFWRYLLHPFLVQAHSCTKKREAVDSRNHWHQLTKIPSNTSQKGTTSKVWYGLQELRVPVMKFRNLHRTCSEKRQAFN